MRRLQALLLGVGLAVAPAGGALAGPDTSKNKPETVETFESHTVTTKGRLGVLVIQLTPELRAHFGAAKDRGVLVGRVEPSSAAAAAGLHVGDIITDVRGTVVDEGTDVIDALAPLAQGDKATLQVVRDGKAMTLTATMQDKPLPAPRLFDSKLESTWPKWFREMFQTWPLGKPLSDRDTST